MSDHFIPDTPEQVAELVSWALAEGKTLNLQGSGTKTGFGRPYPADATVSLSHLAGIIDYEPTELVMTARAGTSMVEIQDALTAHDQHLAFEPPLLGRLYDAQAAPGTIGGIFMGNLSGPRRFAAGAARDHILGVHAVNGRGELFKSGGAVIKNVTGYDLSKLLTGSWGTLAAITEVTFKVLPAPRASATLGIRGQDPQSALTTLSQLAQSPYELTGLAYIPDVILSQCGVEGCNQGGGALTAVRLEGSTLSVRERMRAVQRQLSDDIDSHFFSETQSLRLWAAIRDVAPFAAAANTPLSDAVVLKVSVPPANAGVLVELLQQLEDCHWYLDAAGGWCWIALAGPEPETVIGRLQDEIGDNGTLLLFRAPDALKQTLGVINPISGSLATLMQRVKASFDPEHTFNPGRLFSV